VANAVSGTLRNTSSVTLDADLMHLDVRRPIDVSGITSSTPVQVEIVSSRGRRTVTVP
jgi:hypothetical protein